MIPPPDPSMYRHGASFEFHERAMAALRARAVAAERERDAARALVDLARHVLEAHYATAGWQTSEKGRLWDALDGLEVAWRATAATP